MTKTMWAVGPDDGEGWASINAPTEQAAKDAYAEENDCGTDWLTANRIEAWDGLEQITGPDWLTNGHGWHCECGGMAFADDGGVVIGGKVYCEDCATIRKGETTWPT